MMKLIQKSNFSSWIFESFQVTKGGLGLYRIFSALFILCFLLPPLGMYDFLGSLPSDFYSPPPGPMWLFDGFPPQIVFYLLHSILIAALLSLLVGFKTKTASLVTAFTLLIIKGLFYSVGKINHDLLVVMLPLVMAFSGWGTAYSIDSWRRSKGEQQEVDSWPLVLLALMIGFMMFTAGFPKILGGWLSLETQATYGHFFKQYFLNGRQDLLASYVLQLDSPLVWELLDYGTVLFETGFLIAIFHPKTTRIFVSFAVIFHFSIMMLLNIAFLPNFLAYAAFLDWTLIHQKVKKYLTVRWSPLLLLVAFFLLIWGIIFLGSQFGIPDLSSDLRIHEFYILFLALPVALFYLLQQGYVAIRGN